MCLRLVPFAYHTVDPTPYTLHAAPYTLHSTRCTLHPTLYTRSAGGIPKPVLVEGMVVNQSRFVFFEKFCRSQPPPKSVNLLFFITNIEDKLTDLYGNELLESYAGGIPKPVLVEEGMVVNHVGAPRQECRPAQVNLPCVIDFEASRGGHVTPQN